MKKSDNFVQIACLTCPAKTREGYSSLAYRRCRPYPEVPEARFFVYAVADACSGSSGQGCFG